MKKIHIILCSALLGICVLTGCGKSDNASNQKNVSVSNKMDENENNADTNIDDSQSISYSADDLTYAMVYNANNGFELLSKYDSIEYVLTYMPVDNTENEEETSETWDLFKENGNYVISRMSDTGEGEVYADNTCYYMDKTADKDNPKYSKGWFMDGVYEEYMQKSVNEFLISESSQEDFDKIEENDDNYVILSYAGENGDERYYYRYTVDKTNLQIQSYEAVIMKTVNLKTEEEIIAKAKVSYNKKVKVPGFVSEIKDANVNNRKVTIHVLNEDGSSKDDIIFEVPQNVTMAAALEDGYGLYKDKDGKLLFDDTATELDENNVYPDSVCYLIKDTK